MLPKKRADIESAPTIYPQCSHKPVGDDVHGVPYRYKSNILYNGQSWTPVPQVRADFSIIFSRTKYGAGRNKKYPKRKLAYFSDIFLLSPTNLFVVKIMRGYSTNPVGKVFAKLFFKKAEKPFFCNLISREIPSVQVLGSFQAPSGCSILLGR